MAGPITLPLWLRQLVGSQVRAPRVPRRLSLGHLLEDRLAPAILTVNSLLDNATANDGLVTLREAISASVNLTTTDLAQTGDGNDTIQFSSAIDGQTIKLTTFVNDLSAGSRMPGPSGLFIKSTNLTIDGETGLTQGITIARDSAAKAFRLFFIGADADVTFTGVTLQGGFAKGGGAPVDFFGAGGGGAAGLGGAIFNDGRVTIQNSTLTGNKAQGGAGGAGQGKAQGNGGGGLGADGEYAGTRLPENGGAGGGPNGGAGGSFGGQGGNGAYGGGGGGGQVVSSTGIILSKGPGGVGGFGGGGGGGGGGKITTGENGGNGGFGGGGGGAGGGSYFGTAGVGGFGGGPGVAGMGGGGAGMGGAIFNHSGLVSISNSTLSGNTAVGGLDGGGGTAGAGYGSELFNYNGTVSATYSTFSTVGGNAGLGSIVSLGNGAGNTSVARINNSIIGKNGPTAGDFVIYVINSGASEARGTNNVITSTFNLGGTNNLVNTFTGDPKLDTLKNNGGRTSTMALTAGSSAINQGDNSYRVYTDQRGSARDITAPDIGAFELRKLQSITFGALANRTYGDADFVISATATSNLPVTFTAGGDASVQQVGGVWYVHITGAGSATITAKQAGNDDYEPAPPVAQSFTVAKAASVTTTVGAGPFTYNRTAQIGGSGTVTGAGGLNTGATSLTYSANSNGTGLADQTNAGAYYVTAHYAGDTNHTASDGAAVAIVINKADAAVTVVGYTGIYDAASHGATGSASGLGGESAGTLNLGATFRNVPGGTAHWVFTGNSNYKDQSGDVAIKITARHITGSFTAANKIYDGTVSATVLTRSLTGVLGADPVTLTGGAATFASKNVGAWPVTLAGATLGGGAAGNYALDSVATTTAKISPKALAGSASTQAALNVAKDGTVSFRIDLTQSGIVDGQTVAQLFTGASFRLTVGGRTYSIRAQASVSGGGIAVSFRMSDELKAILAANTTATNASNAPAVGLKLEATSNDGNYTLDVLAFTRLFNTTK